MKCSHRQRTFNLLLLLLCLYPGVCSSMSQFILTSGLPKCWNTEVAKDTILKIIYQAPDFVANEDNDSSSTMLITLVENQQAPLDVLKGLNREKILSALDSKKRMTHDVKHTEGDFVHQVEADADISICVRASEAGPGKAIRFAFRLEELGDEELADSNSPPAAAVDVNQHLSHLETQFVRIESQMHALLKEADLARQRDAVYHSKSDAMHKATTFWPIVHVGIVLITGFTQANHIVQFFKKRRIV